MKIVLAVFLTPAIPVVAMYCRWRIKHLETGRDKVMFLFSQVPWQEVWQRPQEYATHVGRHTQVVYMAAIQPHQLLIMGRRWNPVMRPKSSPGVLVVSPLVLSGYYKSRFVSRVNCWLIGVIVRPLFHGNREVNVLTNSPFFSDVAGILDTPPGMARLVYDIIDDFPAFDWAPKWARKMDNDLKNRADAITCGTLQLSKSNQGCPFIGCGVNYELFANARQLRRDGSGDTRKEHRVIGFFGTISERIDVELIGQIADNFPDCDVQMIGPCHLEPSTLPQRSNLHWLGLVAHEELPALAAQFDVGLIPFRDTEATRSLNPVKTLEYMAAGVPVVATRLPELEELFGDYLLLAASTEEFLSHIKTVLNGGFAQERVKAARELAKGSSWFAMGEALDARVFSSQASRETSKSTVP